jgi:hypothetical protein
MAARPVVGRFEPIRLDREQCQDELAAFAQLLAASGSLSERRDLLPFFRSHRQLAALLGTRNPNLIVPDRVAIELPLFGDFVVDVAVGDWERKAFCFIEFEDGTPESIFVRRGRSAREWSPRFEHGFGQIVDWVWKLDDLKNTTTFERQFGAGTINASFLLIVGRESGLADDDRPRFRWRRDHVLVGSRHVQCYTFDECLRDLRSRLDVYR